MDRRSFVLRAGALLGAVMARRAAAQGQHSGHGEHPAGAAAASEPSPPASTPAAAVPSRAPGGTAGVVTPNGTGLRWRMVGGVKVGHLVAGELEHEFAPGLRARVLGLQRPHARPDHRGGRGRSRAHLRHQPAAASPTTVHWHGVILPNGMDGVGGLTQKPIPPGETFVYEFTLRDAGHVHVPPALRRDDPDRASGMMGMFVVHPRAAARPRVRSRLRHDDPRVEDRRRRAPPDPNDDERLQRAHVQRQGVPRHRAARSSGRGERVRIRLGNLSPMDHHPIHLHGLSFTVTATDGGDVPAGARAARRRTVLVPVGSAYG